MIYNYIVKIMISNLRKTFFYALVALFVLGCNSTKKKPNFVFIYTDDQRFDTVGLIGNNEVCLLYTSPSPRDRTRSRMPSSA